VEKTERTLPKLEISANFDHIHDLVTHFLHNGREVIFVTFSERLRQLRQEKKMTQAALGQAIDISPRMISFYESGNHFPRDEVILKRLADLFAVSMDYLMGHSELREESSLKRLCEVYKELPSPDRRTVMDFMDFLLEKSKRT
jgi:transcriptional regulator with XRE-family HTH domain